MSRTALSVTLIVLTAVGLAVGGFFMMFERKETEVTTPARGEALYNRFFALERTLAKLDVPVTSLTTLAPARLPLQPDDTLVLGADVSRIDTGTAARIVDWVREGGHLVLPVKSLDEVSHTPLFEALDVLDAKTAGKGCITLDAAADPAKPTGQAPSKQAPSKQVSSTQGENDFEWCGPRFHLHSALMKQADATIGNEKDGYFFVRTDLESGKLSVLSSLVPLEGEQLRQAAQQRFAWRLLAPHIDDGHVYLVYALDQPLFWTLLLTRGWPALLALSLLLAGWMAMRSERLGPLLPVPLLQRRALLEHVQAVGEFLFRRDNGRSLHELVCSALLARVRRRDPVCAMLHGDALYQRLAERYRLDCAQLARAFHPPANAMAFRESVVTLARLRKML
ncbi:DUF4350 domain-containing protein [Dyella tabacisoli]|uniref:DUF4350 domain-containing protein n=1 Tax=Dyella tabacisoli TaxID=2282381 RepID=A0A369UI78_9GAMM|nr:DUF4350 domain-containing protein [Dyella tabacisoli]RDD80454.1 DUF4350 domain-containing protein [Dyella tabacisoli]